MTKIKLGDKVKTLIQCTEETSHGPSTCPKGTIGIVVDDSHYPDIFVEIINKNGDFEMFGYDANDLEIVKN